MTPDLAYSIDIHLPDLQPDLTIQADNIQAMQAMYFAALLEGLRIFDVADLLVEHFLDGQLPLDQHGSSQMRDYLRDLPNRLTDRERQAFYARAFGMSGGDSPEPQSNRQFDDLWARFLVAVDEVVRQSPVEPRAGVPSPGQQVLKQAARDLAANLSLHGYGIGYFAATELQTEIKTVIRLLSMPSILAAFGVRDVWQLIDHVVALDLGGAQNPRRYRTMALSGAVVIGWLARRVDVITSPAADILDLHRIGDPPSSSPMATPTDRDLVDACRNWLAAVLGSDRLTLV